MRLLVLLALVSACSTTTTTVPVIDVTDAVCTQNATQADANWVYFTCTMPAGLALPMGSTVTYTAIVHPADAASMKKGK
jgi:hypothetical protein